VHLSSTRASPAAHRKRAVAQPAGRRPFHVRHPWGRQTISDDRHRYDGPLDHLALDETDVAYVLDSGNAVFDTELDEDESSARGPEPAHCCVE